MFVEHLRLDQDTGSGNNKMFLSQTSKQNQNSYMKICNSAMITGESSISTDSQS